MKKLTLILFTLTFSALAYSPPKPFQSPRSLMKYFLKNMVDYKKTGNLESLKRASSSFDSSDLDSSTRKSVTQTAASQLINTLDRIEKVNYDYIPEEISQTKWIYQKRIVSIDEQTYPVEISIIKNANNQWLFSQQTRNSIKYFETFLIKKNVVSNVVGNSDWKTKIKAFLPLWAFEETLGLTHFQWIGIFFVILLSFIIDRILRFVINKKIITFLNARDVSIDHKTQKAIGPPIGMITFAGIWTVGIHFLEFNNKILSLLHRGGIIAFTIGVVWGAYIFVDFSSQYFEKLAARSENKFDDILVPLLRKSCKVFVICIGVLFIAHSLTINITGLIAGFSIGGAAFAFASKDTVANLFGSLTVILDRPFRIGDWVNITDGIEGTVTEVGFRTTKVRTFYDSLISVPNSKLTVTHIDNFGKRRYRRYSTKIGIQYNTPPKKVEAFCEGIRQIIINHPHTRKDYFHVYFNGFGASSLDILLYVFWEVPNWSEELMEKHRLLMDILQLGNELKIDFAFPTQTLHLFNEERQNPQEISEDPYELGQKFSESISKSSFVKKKSRSSSDLSTL